MASQASSAAALLRVQRPRDMCLFQLHHLENVIPQWGQSNLHPCMSHSTSPSCTPTPAYSRCHCSRHPCPWKLTPPTIPQQMAGFLLCLRCNPKSDAADNIFACCTVCLHLAHQPQLTVHGTDTNGSTVTGWTQRCLHQLSQFGDSHDNPGESLMTTAILLGRFLWFIFTGHRSHADDAGSQTSL